MVITVSLLLTSIPVFGDEGGCSGDDCSLYDTGVLVVNQSTFGVNPQEVDFGSVFLDGAEQTVITKSEGWEVVDATGVGAGWALLIKATDFTNGDYVIPVSNLSVELSTGDITEIAGNTLPETDAPDWVVFINESSSCSILIADHGAGMGSYRFAPEFRLVIPASAHSGVYSSTITATIVSGVQ